MPITLTVAGQLQKSRAPNLAVSPYLSAVNQKLLYAEQLLNYLNTHRTAGHNRYLSEAIAQSVTLQLYQAWSWHIKDVAYHYKLSDPSAIDNVDELVRVFGEQGKSPTEATEMHYLASEDGSWVGKLLKAYQQLSQLPKVRKAEMDFDRLPVIATDKSSNNTDTVFEWCIIDVTNWKQQIKELIDRQREMMIEY